MRALILAAGQGKRLRPHTDDKPKGMVEYKGKPIIGHTIDLLRANGIDQISIVRGYKAERISYPDVRYYFNSEFQSTNMVHSLFCAKAEMIDDLIVCYSDIVFGAKVLRALLACEDPIGVTIDLDWKSLWSARMEDPLLDAETLKLDPNGFITELGKKPTSLDQIEGQYMGLFKISKSAWPKIINFYSSLDRDAIYDGQSFANMYMTSFIQLIINKLMPVRAVKINGGWLEIDKPQDLALEVIF